MDAIVESLNLDRGGYGTDGKLTRKGWQEQCLQAFLSGPEVFNSWQRNFLGVDDAAHSHGNSFEWTVTAPENGELLTTKFGWSDHPSNFVFEISGHTFEDMRFFDGYEFLTGVLFIGNTFKNNFSLTNFTSRKAFYFIGNKVLGATIIQGNFGQLAIFNHNYFQRIVSFTGSTLAGLLCEETVFDDRLHFQGVKVEMLSFNGSKFRNGADFSGDISSSDHKLQTFGRAQFRGVRFAEDVDFSNRKFLHSTDFGQYKGRNTEFKKAPIFHNSELHQNTSFNQTIFSAPNKSDFAAAKAYSTLRHAMSKHQSTRDEQLFLVLEFDAERTTSKRGVTVLYGLYRHVAGYGFSTKRPAIFLILLPFLISLFVYFLLSAYNNCEAVFSRDCQIDEDILSKIIEFTSLQSMPPIGVDKISDTLRDSIFPLHASLVIPIVVAQKILSLIGWFFIALSLRNLFKIK